MKLKWTYKECQEEALKYSYKKDFQKNSSSHLNVLLPSNFLKT